METVGPADELRRAPNRAELLKLYEAAVAEYRFQVQLNWDRAKHYLVFNGVLLGAATGLGASDKKAWLPRLTITKQISALLGLVGAASLLAASLAFYRALVPE